MGRQLVPDRVQIKLLYISFGIANGAKISIYLIQVFILLTASLGIGLQFGSTRKSLTYSFIVGFFTFTSLLSLIYLVIPSKWEITARQLSWLVIFLILILWVRIYLKKFLVFNSKVLINEFGALIILLTIIPIYLTFNIRYHSSPDNHGFGIATAYINSHFSYNYLTQDYLSATGLEKPIFLGQRTPFLDSTWHILDTQLRFTSDMVFTVGRIGFPVLGAITGSQLQNVDAFTSFVLILGIMSMWILGFLILRLSKNLFSATRNLLVTKANNLDKSNKFESVIVIKKEWLWQLLIGLSPWLLVLVIEGAVTQIYLILAVLFQLNLITEYIAFKKHNMKIILYVGPIFISVVYPSGFIFYIGICGLFALLINGIAARTFNLSAKEVTRSNIHILLSLVAVLPITMYLTRYTFIDVIKNFLKGAANRPYDLGPITIFDVLPIFGQRIRTLYPSDVNQAFSPIINSATPGMISLLFLVLIILVITLTLTIKFKKNGFLTSSILILPLILVLLPLRRLYEASTGTAWFPYFYFRDLTLLGALGTPILLALLLFIVGYKTSVLEYFKGPITVISLLLCMLSTNNLLSNFKESSREFNIVKNYGFSDSIRKNLFVSDVPEQSFLVMAMYGEFRLLTDGWNPELISNIDGNKFDVQYMQMDDRGHLITKKIGTFEIPKNMKLNGSVNVADIQKIEGFKGSK